MSIYIDADKLKEMINRQYSYCHGYTGTKKDIYREALLAVKSAIHCQSVSKDIQKVEYGQWQKHYKSGTTVSDGFVSSCCDMWNERKTSYCPNCGAKMNKGEDEG